MELDEHPPVLGVLAFGTVVRPADGTGAVILYLRGRQVSPADSGSASASAEQLARTTGSTVVCARYRTAFPDALDDVHATYQHYANAGGGVVVVGERIGAGLAATLLVRLRDFGAARPRCAVLVLALLDLTMQARSLQFNASADPAFDVTVLRERATGYAGDAVLTEPLLSPVYANLHGLPPVQLLVAGTDPLLDDSLAFAERAARSRLAVDLRVWPDMADLRAAKVAAMTEFIQTWAHATHHTPETLPG